MKFDPSLVYGMCSSPSIAPLGTLYLAATDRGLAGMWFEGQRHSPDRSGWTLCADIRQQPVLQAASEQLQAYFAGTLKQFDLPFDLRGGTDFQQAVWQALLRIPYGETTSYGQLSTRIGKPRAVRAVGTAIGRNPISVIVPCHRVLGADGSLTGYAGGLDRKLALLTLEGVL
ncbi:MAG: methylated-DNA--[protein]-cysteine S-methyltransferase [Burkholderiaceae bacterium]|nr:methylated-DNA--[protein]-cysteine S-methyltransferase [Burkholderiaceae bacterium]